ncbi:MAG: 2-phospho-L-lactate guanylyltransferase, partial [Myxococcales bacterium]
MSLRFSVLLPVKAPGRGKTRLELPDRAPLVRAFALDAIAALRGSSYVDEVLVVSDDADLDLGAPVLPDHGEGDLNRALARAAASLVSSRVAAMLP